MLLLASRRRCGVASNENFHGLQHGYMPYTGHMPLSSEGSYIYVWSGPGHTVCIHMRYGAILFIRGGFVHGGGAPASCYCEELKYPQLHFCFLTSPEDHIILIIFFSMVVSME